MEKNSIILGLLIGLLLPALGYALFFGIFEGLDALGWMSSKGFRPMFRERTCGVLAIALCAFALNFYQKRYLHDTVRGLVVMITLWVVVWIVLFGKYIF